jgi:hypothetical protein
MMPRPIIRMDSAVADELWRHLVAGERGVEEVAFLFASFSREHSVFHVMEQFLVPPTGFAFSSRWHFEISDETRGMVIKRAHDLGLSLIEVHSHDDPDPPQFSPTDFLGFAEFVPHVWWRLRGRPYAAVVIAPGGLDGLAWTDGPETSVALAGIEVSGQLRPASGLSGTKLGGR